MITYRFTRQGPVKKPTFVVREYIRDLPDGTPMRVRHTQHMEGKEAFELITQLCDEGFEEVETGDPFMYVLQKGAA